MVAFIVLMLILEQRSDSAATKELCIIALTKIYCMTHPYQTLVREITTPTLPAFVTSCLRLLSSKSGKAPGVPASTIEVVIQSFATLLPHHTTIYRPFISQMRAAAKPYVAPTLSDGTFVPSSLAESARHLTVLLHQTVARNAGGEEWGKAVHKLLKDIHVTADLVFRAVLEDWESSVGYAGESVDVNLELSGGARNADDLPQWNGIDAGLERMAGLLHLLDKYLRTETSLPVSMPLGAMTDMFIRMLSVAISSPSQSSMRQEIVRLHPAIDRNEREGLWSGIPQIYTATLQVISTMIERLQEAFLPMAQGFLDQLAWVFPHGRHYSDFRRHSYCLMRQLLPQIGQALGKASSSKCSSIIRSCCNDLIKDTSESAKLGSDVESAKKSNGNTSNTDQNADLILQHTSKLAQSMTFIDTELTSAARNLLPMFLSCIPQQHMDISLRSFIERTAILSYHKDAMLAAVLRPFTGKNGKLMTSILPYLTVPFSHDDTVEMLLRPRMPLLPTATDAQLFREEGAPQEDDDEEMELESNQISFVDASHGNALGITQEYQDAASAAQDTAMNHPGLVMPMPVVSTAAAHVPEVGTESSSFEELSKQPNLPQPDVALTHVPVPIATARAREGKPSKFQLEIGSESDDESVHLMMELDTDSESDG